VTQLDDLMLDPVPASLAPPRRWPMARAFRSEWSGWIGCLVLAAFVVLAVIAPGRYGAQAVQLNAANQYTGPSAAHLLGTNALGQDVFARLLVATRLTLELAVGSAGLGLVLGLLLGGVTAVAGRRTRGFLLRVIDTLLSFPALLIAIFLITIIGPGELGAIIGVGAAESFYFARISSSLGLSIIEQDYVQAARVTGVRRAKLLRHYILPNQFETVVIAASGAVSQCVVTIAAISFLGLGVQFPQYDWGRLLTDGVTGIYLQPWGAIGPAIAIALLAMGFGLVGEALARASNPRVWTAGTRKQRKRALSRAGGPDPGLLRGPGGEEAER
jgi:ABC-type dipeptide/oligopeptide/nickel transport system permease subunit